MSRDDLFRVPSADELRYYGERVRRQNAEADAARLAWALYLTLAALVLVFAALSGYLLLGGTL